VNASTHTVEQGSTRFSWVVTGVIVSALGITVWANIWKNNLKVSEVHVDGNRIVSTKEVLALASIIGGQRLFEVDLSAVQRRVLENTFVKAASVRREAPNRITISLEERIPVAAVAGEKMLYLDGEGFVLPFVRSEHVFDLPVLTGAADRMALEAGKQATDANIAQALNILTASQRIDNELYRRISEVHVEGDKDIILYAADAGVPVIFGRGETGPKLTKFNEFWKQVLVHRGAHELSYIDLRFHDQVVVRWNQDKEKTKPFS
jgi:cell division protein FtsQ